MIRDLKNSLGGWGCMSNKNSTTGGLVVALTSAVLYGLVGLIVMFAAGSRSSSGTYATIATSVWFLLGSIWFVGKSPSGKWISGLAMNLPLWLFFVFIAEDGQLSVYKWGLVACLVSAYVGVSFGVWRTTLQSKTNKRIMWLVSFIAVSLLTALFITSRQPIPVSADRLEFVGRWRSASGFELQISADGRARIIHNHLGSMNLRIEVAPDQIEGATVQFIGDTILEVGKPSYYGKTYRIDRSPYRDSTGYAMALNGMLLSKQL